MACDYNQLPHPGIQSLSPYIPGKSAEEVAAELGVTDIIKLASNENPFGCSQLAINALATLPGKQIALYPLAGNHPLRKKLAERLGVEKEMIALGNGSDALIPLLQTCFALHQDKHMLTHQYAFIAYGIYAKTLGIPVVTTPLQDNWQVDIDEMIKACNKKTGLILIASPNNPTGLLIKQEEIKRLLENIPETTILAIDEAYYDYVDDHEKLNTIALQQSFPNLIIMRTFSKIYGLAGLRLGYAITSKPVSSIFQRALPPFGVNEAALVAAEAALDDTEFVRKSALNNAQGLKQLQQGLKQLKIDYLPTAANFIMFDCKKDSLPIYQGLQQHGVIVRPLHPYGLANYLRVTIGTPEQNTRFLDKLAIVIE